MHPSAPYENLNTLLEEVSTVGEKIIKAVKTIVTEL
jgi:hypothetical protein